MRNPGNDQGDTSSDRNQKPRPGGNYYGGLIGTVIGGLSWAVIGALAVDPLWVFLPAGLIIALLALGIRCRPADPAREMELLAVIMLIAMIASLLFLNAWWGRFPSRFMGSSTGVDSFNIVQLNIFLIAFACWPIWILVRAWRRRRGAQDGSTQSDG